MRFQNLDLNLLVVLHALLQEKSVTRAADRLHISQSTASSALGRLRDYFGDDLLVMKGRNMTLTEFGERLVDPISGLIDNISTTISPPGTFEPRTSDRRMSIMASDYSLEVLIKHALLLFEAEAPAMTFEIVPLADEVVEELKRGRADLLVTLDTFISTEHPHEVLYEDDYVVVGWEGNAALDEGMSRELYTSLGHIVPRFGRSRIPSFEDWALRSQSAQRRIEAIAPSFYAVPHMLVGSSRIATMHRRLAVAMAHTMPLRLMEAPFEIPHVRQAAQWAKSSSNDAGIAWLVRRLREIAADLNGAE